MANAGMPKHLGAFMIHPLWQRQAYHKHMHTRKLSEIGLLQGLGKWNTILLQAKRVPRQSEMRQNETQLL